jgi:hypothetical protein
MPVQLHLVWAQCGTTLDGVQCPVSSVHFLKEAESYWARDTIAYNVFTSSLLLLLLLRQVSCVS